MPPAADAVSFNNKFRGSNDAYLLKVRAQFGLPVVNVSDDALAQAVFDYQTEAGLDATDGKLNDATVARLRDTDGVGSTDWGAGLDVRDQQNLQAVTDEAAALRADPNVTADQLRDSIVHIGETQIGTVNSLDRGDGKKYGGFRIFNYFTICADTSPSEPMMKANASPPREWCGIFAVWCVNLATGNGQWGADSPTGFTKVWRREDQELANLKRGDICVIAELSHHFLVVRRDGDNLVTIDGNTNFQGVNWATHPVSSIVAYYTTISDGGSTPAPAPGDDQ
jgi:hypothetical protein